MTWSGLCLAALSGLVSAVPASVLAATFALPIPELVGGFQEPTVANVTFPIQFESISDVRLTITAQGIPEVFERCSSSTDCTQFDHGPSLIARFDRDGALPIRLIFGASEDFSQMPTTLSFSISDRDNSWNFLLDGSARLEVFFNGVSFLPSDPVRLVQAPVLEIVDAQLTVTGTPVPEPGTAIILLAGLVMLSGPIRRLTSGCS